jgi:hypothetical protein
MQDMKKTPQSPPSTAPDDRPAPPQDAALTRFAQLTAMALHADIALVELVDGWSVWRSGADQANREISITDGQAGIAALPSAAALRQLSDPLAAKENGFAFYACVPLQVGQSDLGKLVIVNRSSRDAGAEEIALLRVLADVIVDVFQPRIAAFRQLRRA